MSETKPALSFEALVSSLPDKPKEEDTFTIAMGDYFPGSEDVLTYHKLKAHLLFGTTITTLVERIQNQRCTEDESVVLEMAFIIACHESPKVDKPELLVPAYVLLFTKFDEVQKWQFVQEFKEKGGQEFIDRMLQVVAAKKNSLAEKIRLIVPDGKSSDSVSATASVTRKNRARNSHLTTTPKSPLTTS